MIPVEVATLASLIFPDWPNLDDDDPEEKKALKEVLAAAHRIHNAGYRPVSNGDGNTP